MDLTGVDLQLIESTLRTASSPHEKRILGGIQMWLHQTNFTAAQVSAQIGISERQLFYRLRSLRNGDLNGALARGHGGGRKPRLNAGLQEELKKRVIRRDKTEEILRWLERDNGISMTRDGLNFWKRKLGCTRSRQRNSRRSAVTTRRVRGDLLCLRLDDHGRKACELLIELVETERALTTLSVLLRLHQENGRLCKVATLAEEIGCSVATLYVVAARFRAAGSKWDRFINTGFSKIGAKEIRALLQALHSKRLF